MARKRIGVIISQVEQTYQKMFVEELLSEAFSLDMDVLLFTPFLKECSDAEYVMADNNIFNIINYNSLDGIIFAADAINDSPIKQKLTRSFVSGKISIPILSVDYETEGMECIVHDDAEDIKKIVDHLIEVHGCTRINFMTGFKGHPHSEKRIEGYKQALAKHNIPFEEERVFYGDFWYDKGEECVSAFLDGRLTPPDAIAFANDPMAQSVIDALRQRGRSVPENVAVTGYDCSRNGCRDP